MEKVKPVPQRPPPPRFVPRKGLSVDDSPSGTGSQQSSLEFCNKTQKPKPPVRTRKKKFLSVDELDQATRQSEFVELSTSDIVEYENEGEKITDQKSCIPEEDIEVQEDSTNQIKGTDKEEWELISENAAEPVPNVNVEESCLQPNG